MKPTSPIGIASWMLEHLTFGCCDEGMLGDLQEELRLGRSKGWYWHQVLSAMAAAFASRAHSYALPLLFSVGWSALYRNIWPSILKSRPIQTLLERVTERDVPFSTGLQSVGLFLPALLFVWLGFFVFLASRRSGARPVSALKTIVGLSISLNVLFIASIVEHLRDSNMGIGRGSGLAGANAPSHLVVLNLPLALSLFSALWCALASTQRGPRAHLLAG